MTNPDLERELRHHYHSLDVGPAGRATSRVEQALDRAPARRWSLGRLVPGRRILITAAAVAVVAVLGIALMPLWRGSIVGPGTSPDRPTTSGQESSPTPTATSSLLGTPSVADVRAAQVSEAGMTPAGVIWATRVDALSISTDNGRTWKENPLPSHASPQAAAVVFAVADADHAWQLEKYENVPGGTFAVFRTSDGGATWERADLPGTYGGVPIRMTFVDSKVGFVILTADQGTKMGPTTILRTQDGGATWAVTATTPILEDPIVALDANTLWTAALWGGMSSNAPGRPLLRVSRDAGATWSSVSLPGVGGSQASADLYVLAGPTGGVQFVSATEGYVAVYSSAGPTTRYYRTADGGTTWSLVATEPGTASLAPVFVDATHWYRQGDPAHLGLQVTADGGAAWTTVAGEGFEFETGIIDIWTVDGRTVAAFCSVNPPSGGISALYVTRDGGKTWRPADFSAR